MKTVKFVFLTTIILILFTGCTNTQSKVTGIIDQMPAETSQGRDALAAELVTLNPKATKVLAAMLLPQTDPNDTAARFALSALTHYTGRHGAETERAAYAAALIEALPTVSEKQNQAFLISQLQLAGKNEAVAPLGAYLNDDVLCDYAARALLTIDADGADGVEAQFLTAFDSVTDATAPTIIKALGQLQSKKAVKKITRYAASKDRATREAALYALANIGDPSSQKTLAKAAQIKNAYTRAHNTALYLLYAQRLAEAGKTDSSVRVCGQVVRFSKDNPGARAAAVNTLRNAIDDDPTKITNPKLRQRVEKLLAASKKLAPANQPPKGFVALFNGKDLTGWKGLLASPNDNPIKRAQLTPEQLAAEQKKADDLMRKHWKVVDGVLEFDGDGFSLATIKHYTDFEMLVDWKILHPKGDSGIYLRGTPQVQIWDPDQHKVGSGGLYNNQKNPSKPSMTADKPIGQWNTFRIKMVGEKVSVHLNGKLVVDNVTLENYWDRSQPIFPSEQIELQCHGDPIHFKNIFIREINSDKSDEQVNTLTAEEKADGFVQLFNGTDLTGWVGSTDSYGVKDGILFCRKGTGRNIYTEKEYGNFVLRFDFKLDPGTNNGLGIRTPTEGDAAYVGMELQILDDTHEKYSNLHDWQYHGSVYGIIAADGAKSKKAFKPVGQWNTEEVIADGTHITVKVNGETIVDGDIKEAVQDGTLSGKEHPGLLNEKGHIGFLGHGDYVEFRNLRIKEL